VEVDALLHRHEVRGRFPGKGWPRHGSGDRTAATWRSERTGVESSPMFGMVPQPID
jgi:hypothetical protein